MRFRSAFVGLRTIRPYLPANYKRSFLALLGLGVIAGLLEATVLAAIGALAATLSADSANDPALPLLGETLWQAVVIVGLSASVVVILLRFVEANIITRVSIEPVTTVRDRLVRESLASSFTTNQAERIGELQELLMTFAPRVGLAVFDLAAATISVTILIVLSVAAIVVDPLAFVVIAAVGAFFGIVLVPFQRLSHRYATMMSETSIRYASNATESTAAATELRAHDVDAIVADSLHLESLEVADAIRKNQLLSLAMPTFYRSSVLALIIGGLAILAARGFDDLTAASTLALIMIRVVMETQMLHRFALRFAESMPFATEIGKRLERYMDRTGTDRTAPMEPFESATFRGVTYAYPDETDSETVLDNIGFEICRGERVGLVGSSGAGKTTLLALLVGALIPDSGRVLVNDSPPQTYSTSSWARQVAIVPQRPILLTTSVRENIRFFREWVSDEAIEDAARAAGIHDEILSWPDGYETIVGERGVRAVSGGQSQRLCIARALAGQPSLVILDEPTSALDSAAEEVVAATIGILPDDCSVLVVSHRRTTLTSCDRLLELSADGIKQLSPRLS